MNSKLLTIIILLIIGNNYFYASFSQTQHSVNFIYWEDVATVDKVLLIKSGELESIALDYLFEKNIPANSSLDSLLERISSINEQSRLLPLYFHLLNKICINADGEIGEILGIYCQKFILIKPEYVLNYFIVHRRLEEIYADLVGYELYFKEKGASTIEFNFTDFKDYLENRIIGNRMYNEILAEFLQNIKTAMNNMN